MAAFRARILSSASFASSSPELREACGQIFDQVFRIFEADMSFRIEVLDAAATVARTDVQRDLAEAWLGVADPRRTVAFSKRARIIAASRA